MASRPSQAGWSERNELHKEVQQLVIVAVGGLEPPTYSAKVSPHVMMIVTKNLWSPTGIALPTELHGTPYIFIPTRKLRSATTASIYPIRTIGLTCQIIDVSFIVLRLYRNHSALLDSLHAPTQPYTTTYLLCMLLS